ncbi:hypothetical protein MXB_1070, partial [Myxobolus squamalis]
NNQKPDIINEENVNLTKIDSHGLNWNIDWVSCDLIKMFVRIHRKPPNLKINDCSGNHANIISDATLWEIKMITHVLDFPLEIHEINCFFKPYFTNKYLICFLKEIKTYYDRKQTIQKLLNKSKMYQYKLYCLHQTIDSCSQNYPGTLHIFQLQKDFDDTPLEFTNIE